MEKRRRIIDFEKLNNEIVALIHSNYPNGYLAEINVYKNHKGEVLKALEIETNESILLIKITPQTELIIDEVSEQLI